MWWQWIKSTIFKPVATFFSGIYRSIRGFFANDQQPVERQPLLPEAPASISSAPIVQTLATNPLSSQAPIEADRKQDKKTDPFPLLDLIEEVRKNEIYPKFSLKECGLFAQTSQAAEEAVAFLRLLPSAVDAEPESYKQEDETKLAAIAILKRHPDLLFRKGLVTDHYGRKIWASAIRLFFGTGDIWALKPVYESIIPRIKDGEAKAEAEFKDQFPNCPWPFNPDLGEEQLYDARNIEQVAQVVAQLQVMDAEITADPCTNGLATLEETKKAVEALRQIYLPNEDKVIRTGLHFPPAIQRKIHELYNARLTARLNNQPNAWSWDQLAFFSREVIGTMEEALTSVEGQCVKTGADSMNMEKGPDRRDGLFCRQPKGIPAELAPLKGKLGRSVFVDPTDGYSCFLTSVAGSFYLYNKSGWAARLPTWEVWCCSWKTYGEQKQRLMAAIMRPQSEKSTHRRDHDKPRCVIL